MIKRLQRQTREEWEAEYKKQKEMTLEERNEEIKRICERMRAFDEERKKQEQHIKEENAKNFYGDCDHPNTMENSTATVLYIIVMLVGIIFVDRWMIWIAASVVYFRFITRHERRKREEEKNKHE